MQAPLLPPPALLQHPGLPPPQPPRPPQRPPALLQHTGLLTQPPQQPIYEAKKEGDIRIAMLSQNAIPVLKKFVLAISDIVIQYPDIYVEMTQEDSRPPRNNMLIPNGTFQKNNINSLWNYPYPYNIVLKIYTNDSNATFENNVIQVDKDNGNRISIQWPTKGAVCTKMTTQGQKFLFVNMHLPSKTDPAGYEARKAALTNIIQQLINTGFLDENTTLIMGGDLNFRINASTNKDELTQFLATNIATKKIEEFIFPNPNDKKFTCKLRTENVNNCRNTPEPSVVDGTDTATSEDIQKITGLQNECGYADRYPSRCDRFLYHSTVHEFKVLKHTGTYLEPLKSDHNAIYIVFDATIPPLKTVENTRYQQIKGQIKGGKRKSKKRNSKTMKKRKSKRYSRRRRSVR
jgi:hypothetical protein